MFPVPRRLGEGRGSPRTRTSGRRRRSRVRTRIRMTVPPPGRGAAVAPIAQRLLASSFVGDHGEHQACERGGRQELLQQHEPHVLLEGACEHAGAHDRAGDADEGGGEQREGARAPRTRGCSRGAPARRSMFGRAHTGRRRRPTRSPGRREDTRQQLYPVPRRAWERIARVPRQGERRHRALRRCCPSTSAATCPCSRPSTRLPQGPSLRRRSWRPPPRRRYRPRCRATAHRASGRAPDQSAPSVAVPGWPSRPPGHWRPRTAGITNNDVPWCRPARRQAAGRRRWPASTAARRGAAPPAQPRSRDRWVARRVHLSPRRC